MSSKKVEKVKKVYLGRPSNDVSIGIVGMPNIGKSSLFNLLSKLSVPAENYPFCTIDPSFAKVPVPDERFDKLVEMYKPKSVIPAVLTIHDIAGLVRGASEGRGLGNAFLSHIAAVDAIFHICRAFKDKEIEHVEATVDPVRDLDIISAELVAKDLSRVKVEYEECEKIVTRGIDKSKEKKMQLETFKKAKECLEAGTDIREYKWNNDDVDNLNKLQLLTAKPIVYLINISKKDYETKSNKFLGDIVSWVQKRSPDAPMIPVSVTFEQEWLKLADEEKEKSETKSAVPKITVQGYKALNLVHYFTCGPDEVRAWTIKQGTLAPAAAGVIHTDFQKFFVMAEVFSYEDLVKYGSESEVKKNGKLGQRGKDYEFKDADIAFFKHTAGGSGKKK
jgi:obg-like ATPase 1